MRQDDNLRPHYGLMIHFIIFNVYPMIEHTHCKKNIFGFFYCQHTHGEIFCLVFFLNYFFMQPLGPTLDLTFTLGNNLFGDGEKSTHKNTN